MKKNFYNSKGFIKNQKGFLGLSWPKSVRGWISAVIAVIVFVSALIYAIIFGDPTPLDCRQQCDVDFTESEHSLSECYASCPPE